MSLIKRDFEEGLSINMHLIATPAGEITRVPYSFKSSHPYQQQQGITPYTIDNSSFITTAQYDSVVGAPGSPTRLPDLPSSAEPRVQSEEYTTPYVVYSGRHESMARYDQPMNYKSPNTILQAQTFQCPVEPQSSDAHIAYIGADATSDKSSSGNMKIDFPGFPQSSNASSGNDLFFIDELKSEDKVLLELVHCGYRWKEVQKQYSIRVGRENDKTVAALQMRWKRLEHKLRARKRLEDKLLNYTQDIAKEHEEEELWKIMEDKWDNV